MIDRGDISGVTVAVIGHAGLIALILLFAPRVEEKVIRPATAPIEVTLADEVALDSSVPDPGTEEPAARLSPVEAPVEPDAAPAEAEKPDPVTKPTPPKPAPAPDAADRRRPDRTSAAQSASKGAATKPPTPSGSLDGISFTAPGSKPNNSTNERPPAAVSGPVRSALLAELRRMMKPNWKAPTGADDNKLRTWVRVKLRRDGGVESVTVLRQEGKTDLNRAQWELHAERALAAVRKTRFDTSILKDEYYSVWGQFDTYFDKRL